MILVTSNANVARSLADHLTCCKIDYSVKYEDIWTFNAYKLTVEQLTVAYTILNCRPTLIDTNKVALAEREI